MVTRCKFVSCLEKGCKKSKMLRADGILLVFYLVIVFVGNSEQGSLLGSKIVESDERQMKMRASGDPHFQTWLTTGIRVCFQWSGQDGDIFNLLSDYSVPLFVNARFSNGKKSRGQFLTVISFVLPNDNLIVTMTPFDVILNDTGTNHVTTIVPSAYNKPYDVFGRNGIQISVSKTAPQVQLTVDGVRFEIMERNGRHLDIEVVNPDALSQNLGGIFGEPSKQKVKPKVIEVNGKHFLRFNKRKVPIHTKNTESEEKFPCWHLKGKIQH